MILIFKVYFEKGHKDEKKKEWYQERKIEWNHMRGWSVNPYFGLNDFTHELIGPQTNNILLILWGHKTSQEMLKFCIIGPKIFGPQLLIFKQNLEWRILLRTKVVMEWRP
jgi:hypothetical protein